MKTRQQKSDRNDFEAFTQERVDHTCKRNIASACFTDVSITRKTAFVHVAGGSYQKLDSFFVKQMGPSLFSIN